MPLYRQDSTDGDVVYQPISGGWIPTRLMMEEWNSRCRMDKDTTRNIDVRSASIPLITSPVQEHKVPAQHLNHKVAAVRQVSGEHDVYCLTVPEAGNFALEAGVFVHNCGILVNVTPFEPEWEGYVTLEFSNTTPLPAKIYANEGVAQVIFFESDEVCETSYKDRGGKYLKQHGVTLPKL
jgi:hypothetical protein